MTTNYLKPFSFVFILNEKVPNYTIVLSVKTDKYTGWFGASQAGGTTVWISGQSKRDFSYQILILNSGR